MFRSESSVDFEYTQLGCESIDKVLTESQGTRVVDERNSKSSECYRRRRNEPFIRGRRVGSSMSSDDQRWEIG